LKRSIGATRSASIARGIAKMDSPLGMILAYATQAGRTADDGKGRNSPYTTAFLKHIEAQEEIGTVFRRMSADVFAATSQTQLPGLSVAGLEVFFLRGRPQPAPVPAPAAPADPCAAAETHWRSAVSLGTIAAFEDHLRQFPSCAFAGLAREKI